MKVLRSVGQLRAWRDAHATVGFVPTMGALHAGHMSLLRQSFADNQATVVSVFVNPSQFSPNEDLDSYPRTFDEDFAKINDTLREFSGRQVAIFHPTVSEMYPSGFDLDRSKQIGTFVEVLGCSHQLEGAVRPHFFRGVATVLTKLFNAVQPTTAYFGQKDIQQTVVVKRLVKDLLMPIRIVIGPTAREPSGLAMSSRNVYLDAPTKERATILYKSLRAGRELWKQSGKKVPSKDIYKTVTDMLNADPVVKTVEYVSINDLDMFDEQACARPGDALSAAVVLQNGIRILDNVILE